MARNRLCGDIVDNSIGLTGDYLLRLRTGYPETRLVRYQSDPAVAQDVAQFRERWVGAHFILKPDGQFQLRLMDENASRVE